MGHVEHPPISVLQKLLRYEPESGKLYWRERLPDMFQQPTICNWWNARYAHTEAFTAANADGYLTGRIWGKTYSAHRMIWAVHHGIWPNGEVDHVNGDPADNRIDNLRDVSPSANRRNARKRRHNTSGHNGITWNKQRNKWHARITFEGHARSLGLFTDINDAIAARKDAEAGLDFTERHGSDGGGTTTRNSRNSYMDAMSAG